MRNGIAFHLKTEAFQDKWQSAPNPAIGGRSRFCNDWRKGKLWPSQHMMKSNISDVAVHEVGMDVRVKFGDSVLNSGRII